MSECTSICPLRGSTGEESLFRNEATGWGGGGDKCAFQFSFQSVSVGLLLSLSAPDVSVSGTKNEKKRGQCDKKVRRLCYARGVVWANPPDAGGSQNQTPVQQS
eukprot:Sspe_Gene.68074::Locus_40159_Transcript_1_1_Confidence_1.000_Length_733::g.68074::m.68074